MHDKQPRLVRDSVLNLTRLDSNKIEYKIEMVEHPTGRLEALGETKAMVCTYVIHKHAQKGSGKQLDTCHSQTKTKAVK